MVVGGGSGGHVTPVIAVLDELQKISPGLAICFVCDRKFAPQAQKVIAASGLNVEFHTIFAGKLRRYHGIPLWKQLLDIPTVLQNLRDIFLIGLGFLQSVYLMLKCQPDTVFTKGGFVCLPAGMAAAAFRKPLIVHDSDAHPGLTNRILAKWATFIATGAPLENYNYDPKIARYVGIPVARGFKPPNQRERVEARNAVMVEPSRILVVATGGGLGAVRLNTALATSAPELLKHKIEVVHITGAGNARDVELYVDKQLNAEQRPFYHVEAFVDNKHMAQLMRAADIAVSRGGATALTELAVIGLPSILIPNPRLTGGHQLKNAQVLANAKAAVVLDEEQLLQSPQPLVDSILAFAKNSDLRRHYSSKITAFSKPKAALHTAQLILAAAEGRNETL